MTIGVERGGLSWPRLVGIQFALVFRSGRWVELVGGALVLLCGAWAGPLVASRNQVVFGQKEMSLLIWLVSLVVLVACWPTMLWRGESPRSRRYHWSHPVSRGAHDLARVVAGGMWVLVVVGLVGLARLSVFRNVQNGFALLAFLDCALGLVTLYCVASIAAVVTAHPARWFFGIVAGYGIVAVASAQEAPDAGDWLGAPLVGTYGFLVAVTGLSPISIVGRDVEVDTVQMRRSTVMAPLARGASEGERPMTRKEFDSLLNATPPHGQTDFVAQSDVATAYATQRSAMASGLWLVGALAILLWTSVRRHEQT